MLENSRNLVLDLFQVPPASFTLSEKVGDGGRWQSIFENVPDFYFFSFQIIQNITL